MKLRMYAVQDSLSGFMTPVVEQSDPVAVRNFRMACDSANGSSTLMTWNPTDFSLYHIADYDSDTGIVTSVVPIELICRGEKNA